MINDPRVELPFPEVVPEIILLTDNLVSSYALTLALAYSNVGLVCLLS